jgi:hypothetical protein
MMQISGNHICVSRFGRELPIARFTQVDYFRALVAFGVLPSFAAAATRNVVTIRIKAGATR